MMNNRGTEYSRDHIRVDTNSQEYWDYDFFDEWLDVEANIRVMKSFTGYNELYYVGYSSATTQMLYGMVEDSAKLENKLLKAVFLAPCTIPANAPPGAIGIWKSGIDVYSFSGPNWSEDKPKACAVIPEADCDQLNSYDKRQATSVKSNAHLGQLAESNRFQKFVKEWPTKKVGVKIDLDRVRYPISMYVDQFDTVCLAAIADLTKQ